jgi:small-conductance mechanosensitive channel
MNRIVDTLRNVSFQPVENWERVLTAVLIFVGGFIVLRIGTGMVIRAFTKGLRDQSRELLRKTFLYIGTALLFVMVLNGAGVSVGALLGAAGVLGIAVGIASQASLSNIISGLFLVSERFFEIGDVVRIGDHVGTVQSIDLLSIKVKTFDNVLIRIPNQQLIEKDIVNITRYPIRRMDFTVTVAPTEDVERALEALRFAADGVAQVLEEPEPFAMAGDFLENGLTLRLGVWFERPNYVTVRNAIVLRLQQVFRERSIEIRARTVTLDKTSPPGQRQRTETFRI